MKRTLYILFALFLSSQVINAKDRTYDQAVDIARSQAKKLGISTSLINSSNTRALPENKQSYYAINLGNAEGYVLVARDEKMPEIIGYSTRGFFDYERIPSALRDLLRAFDTNMSQESVDYNSLLPSYRGRTRANSVEVQPLIKTNWGQGAPFNNYAPNVNADRKCAAGCVAIAMSQVLNYYKYPAQLASDLPDYVAVNGRDYPGVEQGGPYDWDNILDSYQKEYNEVQANAVAKLVHDCGVSVKSDYDYETGADCMNLGFAFSTYFNMDEDLYAVISRRTYNVDQWIELLTNELIASRPVIYSAKTAEYGTGHAFICDGIDADGNFHINWGWDGSSDGYYNISVLNPYDPNTSEGYIYYAQAYIGITPDNGVKDEPLVTAKPIVLCDWQGKDIELHIDDGHRNSPNDNFYGYLYPHVENIGDKEISFKLTVGIKDENGNPCRISNDANYFNTRPSSIWEGTCYFSYPIPVGTTQLYCLISFDDEQTWDFIPGSDDYPLYVKTTTTDLYALPRNPGLIIPLHKEMDDLDLHALTNILLDKGNFDGLYSVGCDANWDGAINAIDYVYLTNKLYGKDSSHAESDYFARLSITSANVLQSDKSGIINFSLNSYGYEATCILFDLFLPQGVTIKKGYNGRYVIRMNNDRLVDDETFDNYDDHQVFCNDFGNGCYRIMISSESSTPFIGTSGELFSIKLDGTDSLSSGEHPLSLENISVVSPNAGGVTNLRLDTNLSVSEQVGIKGVTQDTKSSSYYSIDGASARELQSQVPYVINREVSSGKVMISRQ